MSDQIKSRFYGHLLFQVSQLTGSNAAVAAVGLDGTSGKSRPSADTGESPPNRPMIGCAHPYADILGAYLVLRLFGGAIDKAVIDAMEAVSPYPTLDR